jgi:hypothetical protein
MRDQYARASEDCEPDGLVGVRFPMVGRGTNEARDLPRHLRDPSRQGDLGQNG